jgi:predicted metal-dependent phosphoesterase TrpH
MVKELSREEAKDVIEECDGAVLITHEIEEVPVLGELSDGEERQREIRVEAFEVGEVPEEFDVE